MVTIHDVAKAAGVSVATVSRVLNKHANVHPETRARVQSVLQDMNYVPNMTAAALLKHQTETMALVVPDITNPFFTTLVRGFEDKAMSGGFTVIIGNTDEDAQKEKKYVDTLLRKRVDGLALIPTHNGSGQTCRLARMQNTPTVLLDRAVDGIDDVDVIRGDSFAGAKELVGHLVGLGHTKVAIVTGPEGIVTSEERLQGYKEALKEAGIPLNQSYIRHSEFKRYASATTMRKLLATDPRPTAVFAANNFIALDCIEVLREVGLRIPDDMAVVSFDDLEIASILDPFLTVAAQPSYLMGSLAAEFLLNRIQERRGAVETRYPPQEIKLKTRLIVRRSCGAEHV